MVPLHGGADAGEVKDIRSGEQVPAASDEWQPAADLRPRLLTRDTRRLTDPYRVTHEGP